MSVTAPFDIEEQPGDSAAGDRDDVSVEGDSQMTDIVVVDDPRAVPVATALPFHGDPVMTFVYFGVISFVAIVIAAALLAL